MRVIEVLPPAVQTELHDAEGQPYIKDGRSIGMPLDQFVAEMMDGLAAGKDQIAIGFSKAAFDGWEQQRQEGFARVHEMMSKGDLIKDFYAH